MANIGGVQYAQTPQLPMQGAVSPVQGLGQGLQVGSALGGVVKKGVDKRRQKRSLDKFMVSLGDREPTRNDFTKLSGIIGPEKTLEFLKMHDSASADGGWRAQAESRRVRAGHRRRWLGAHAGDGSAAGAADAGLHPTSDAARAAGVPSGRPQAVAQDVRGRGFFRRENQTRASDSPPRLGGIRRSTTTC